MKGAITDGQGLGRGVYGYGGIMGLALQIGASNATYNRMTVNIIAMDSDSLGMSEISVITSEAARNSMDKIDGSITAVSEQRGSLGAMQNRLEHTVNSLRNQIENITAAESQIRDVDMAAEMVKYTKYRMLMQVSQSILTQANQTQQFVLQLLR